MRFSKKSMALFLTTSIIVSLFVGCTNKKDDESASGNNDGKATEKVTLTVWESNDGADEFIRQAGEAYTKINPNVTIKCENVEIGDAKTQIALDGPAGTGPDLFAAPSNDLGELLDSSAILAVNDQNSVTDTVLSSCATAVTSDGTIYGYPISAETYALFYNKALISDEEVPTTFEDLVTWCKDFNSKNSGKYGFMLDPSQAYYTVIFTTANGNRVFGENGTDTSSTYMNTEDAITGMKYFQSLRKDILDLPAADLTYDTCKGAFEAGNAAMFITGLWDVANFQKAGVDFGVAALPALPGTDTPAVSFSTARTVYVSAYSNYTEQANDFAQFLLTEDMQKLRFEITGALPSVDITAEADYVEGFLTQLDNAFPTPSISEMGNWWEPMNAASANIWDGADVKTELDAADKTTLGK